MTTSAFLGLIACQLVMTDCVPRMQRYDDMPRSLSNIELLIPLMTSDTNDASDESDTYAAGERYERARVEKDMPFSNIPSSAFVLDKSHPSSAHKHKSGHKHRRKQDLKSRSRSVDLESIGSTESDESVVSAESDESTEQGKLAVDIWRACSRLLRSPERQQHELLLALCSELLEAAPPAPHPAPPARRDLLPMGENSYWVQSYMKSPRKRRHRPEF